MQKSVPIAILALLLQCSCSSDEARIRFSFRDYAQLDRQMLAMVATDGSRIIQLTSDDFKPVADSGDFARTSEIATSKSGTLQVVFQIADDNASVATGSFELPLRPDWIWHVDFIPGEAGKTAVDFCMGCFGSAAFPVAVGYGLSETDSLYVIWSGNSIENPVIF